MVKGLRLWGAPRQGVRQRIIQTRAKLHKSASDQPVRKAPTSAISMCEACATNFKNGGLVQTLTDMLLCY